MQTLYRTLSYQTPISRNCKSFKTQLWGFLLATHKIQTLKTYMTKPRSFQWTPISNCYSTKTTDSNTDTPLYDLNAYSDSPRNMKATIFHNNEHIIISDPNITPEKCRENLKHIYTTITSQ